MQVEKGSCKLDIISKIRHAFVGGMFLLVFLLAYTPLTYGQSTSCGNSILEGTEACDDGNKDNGDGCSSLCQIEPGWRCDSKGVCTAIQCGDGIVAEKEACDDGNTLDGDGCSSTCNIEVGWSCPKGGGSCIKVYVLPKGVADSSLASYAMSGTSFGPIEKITFEVRKKGSPSIVCSGTIQTPGNSWTATCNPSSPLTKGLYIFDFKAKKQGSSFVAEHRSYLSLNTFALTSFVYEDFKMHPNNFAYYYYFYKPEMSLLPFHTHYISELKTTGQRFFITGLGVPSTYINYLNSVYQIWYFIYSDKTISSNYGGGSVTYNNVQADGTWIAQVSINEVLPLNKTLNIKVNPPNSTFEMMHIPFTVDNTPPQISFDATTPQANSVVLGTDDVTFSGTVSEDAFIEIEVINPYKHTICKSARWADANNNRKWSLPCHIEYDGTYSFKITATDRAGLLAFWPTNENKTVIKYDFEKNHRLLSVSIIKPTYESHHKVVPVTLEAKSDEYAMVRAEVTDSSQPPQVICNYTERLAIPSYTMSYTWHWKDSCNIVTDGEYHFNFYAKEQGINTERMASTTFVVDRVAPVVTISSPSDGKFLYTRTNEISGTITDADDKTKVKVSVTNAGGTEVCSLPSTDVAGDTWTLSNCNTGADGKFTVKVTATDRAGNVTTKTSSFYVDTVAPDVTISSPTNGKFLNTRTNNITGTVTDADDKTKVAVSVTKTGGTEVCSLPSTDVAGNTWTLNNCNTGADGDFMIAVRAIDRAGNARTITSSFTVDTVAPEVTISSPSDGKFLNTHTNNIKGTVTDADDKTEVKVSVTNSRGTEVCSLPSTDVEHNTWTLSNCNTGADGKFTVTVTATDRVGNITTETSSFYVDTVAPVIAISSPTDGEFLNSRTNDITGTATDDNGQTEVKVSVTNASGDEICSLPSTNVTNNTWTIKKCDTRADGKFTIKVTAKDRAGNETDMITERDPQGVLTEKKTFSFIVDTELPVVAISSPSHGEFLSSRTNDITGTVTDADDKTEVKVSVTNASGDEICSLPSTDVAGNTWTLSNCNTGADGELTIKVTATDRAGNITTTITSFTVDTVPPTVSIGTPEDGKTLNSREIQYGGTWEEGTELAVNLIEVQSGNVICKADNNRGANGDWDSTCGVFADGEYKIVATSTDKAGNQTSVESTFRVDTIPPVVRITSPEKDLVLDNPLTKVSGEMDELGTVTMDITGPDQYNCHLEKGVDRGNTWEITGCEETSFNGVYVIRVTGKDKAGNESTVESTFSISTDYIEFDSNTNGNKEIYEDGLAEVSGKSLPNKPVKVELKGETKETVSDDNGRWTVSFSGIPNGTHEVTVTSNGETKKRFLSFDNLLIRGHKGKKGGCSTTPQSPAEGLLPFLFAAMGIAISRRRKKKKAIHQLSCGSAIL